MNHKLVFKLAVLLITLLLCYLYSNAVEEKVIPKELRPLLKEVGRNDPFLPPAEIAHPDFVKVKNLQLQGILWNEDKPLAVINARVVSEGQKIGEEKIIKIEKSSVIMQTPGGESYTIKLHSKETTK